MLYGSDHVHTPAYGSDHVHTPACRGILEIEDVVRWIMKKSICITAVFYLVAKVTFTQQLSATETFPAVCIRKS